jgi:hypothetical protein
LAYFEVSELRTDQLSATLRDKNQAQTATFSLNHFDFHHRVNFVRCVTRLMASPVRLIFERVIYIKKRFAGNGDDGSLMLAFLAEPRSERESFASQLRPRRKLKLRARRRSRARPRCRCRSWRRRWRLRTVSPARVQRDTVIATPYDHFTSSPSSWRPTSCSRIVHTERKRNSNLFDSM